MKMAAAAAAARYLCKRELKASEVVMKIQYFNYSSNNSPNYVHSAAKISNATAFDQAHDHQGEERSSGGEIIEKVEEIGKEGVKKAMEIGDEAKKSLDEAWESTKSNIEESLDNDNDNDNENENDPIVDEMKKVDGPVDTIEYRNINP